MLSSPIRALGFTRYLNLFIYSCLLIYNLLFTKLFSLTENKYELLAKTGALFKLGNTLTSKVTFLNLYPSFYIHFIQFKQLRKQKFILKNLLLLRRKIDKQIFLENSTF